MAPSRGFTTRLPQYITATKPPYICQTYRHLTTIPPLHSGHNRWSKIKHDKAKVDSVKNKQRSIFSAELSTASKLGGPDPTLNTRLADLITKAKREGFAKSSIEAAIARGQGRSTSGVALESVTVEGILPGNVGVIVECETDNKLRTLADVRLILKEAGGASTPSAYLFEKKGRVVFEAKEGVGVDEALEVALEAGAVDVEVDEEGRVVVLSEPGETKAVGEAVAAALGLQIARSNILWDPKEDTKVPVQSEETAISFAGFVDELEDREPSLQAVAMNVAQGSVDDATWKDLQARLSG
ncbi:hypothetical protein LTR62_001010 [Meristemomyces frigidus]|uniref:Uncharacterized protein n=1 Tax=Meristemomyces frigidus TaxID=1508187 RepID=A0AAN7T9N3_9PEZI|nr:hypothetical protein LTR62_001010 [Meristemomyces frigidus]